MEKVYKEESKCCGCGTCVKVCPTHSIDMYEDEFGFLYPHINTISCIDCRKCKEICPLISVGGNKINYSYAAVLNDEAIKRSASGGAFYALAKSFLESNGVVFGCAFDNHLHAKHVAVRQIEDLYMLQGSKYVQSDMSVHEEILKTLQENRKVLFSGTPCQVAAIKSFVGDSRNLYTIELVCHGVPNAKFWQEYIGWLESKHHGKLTEFQFRVKRPRQKFCMRYTFIRNGKEIECVVPSVLSYYYYGFLKGKIYRPSCYHCPFAQAQRQADITICDFWGYNGALFRNRDDVSAVLIQGEKGVKLFELGAKYLTIEKTTFDKVAEQNEQLKKPTSITKYDENLMKLWISKGASELARKHQREHWKAFLCNVFNKDW